MKPNDIFRWMATAVAATAIPALMAVSALADGGAPGAGNASSPTAARSQAFVRAAWESHAPGVERAGDDGRYTDDAGQFPDPDDQDIDNPPPGTDDDDDGGDYYAGGIGGTVSGPGWYGPGWWYGPDGWFLESGWWYAPPWWFSPGVVWFGGFGHFGRPGHFRAHHRFGFQGRFDGHDRFGHRGFFGGRGRFGSPGGFRGGMGWHR